MTRRRFWSVVWAAFVCVSIGPSPSPAQEDAAEPLPKEGVSRFGISRHLLRGNPSITIAMPECKELIAPTVDANLRRFTLATHKPVEKKGIVGPGQVVASADGKRAAVAAPGVLNVVEVESGKKILGVSPPDGRQFLGLIPVAISGDGKRLAYALRGRNGKGEVIVVNIDADEIVGRFDCVHPYPVFPSLSHDGAFLATHGAPTPPPKENLTPPKQDPKSETKIDPKGDADIMRMAQVWDVNQKIELLKARVTGMGGSCGAAVFSPDNSLFAASAGDGVTDVWDIKATGTRIHTLLGRKAQGVHIAFSPDSKTLATVGHGYQIQRWSMDGKMAGKMLDVTDPPPEMVSAPIAGLVYPDNDRAVAWMMAHQLAYVWEAPSGNLLTPQYDHAAPLRSIVMFEDRKKDPITSGGEGKIYRWDLASGNLSSTITLKPTRIPGQPNVRPVVGLTRDGTRAIWPRKPLEIFDMEDGTEVFSIPLPSRPQSITQIDYSIDGQKVITFSKQTPPLTTCSCVIWDLETMKRFAEFEVSATQLPGAPTGMLSPDDSRLLIAITEANEDGRTVLKYVTYDTKTGKKVAELEDPRANGTITFALANEKTAVGASSLGRIWSFDYAAGRMSFEIDNIAQRGEPATNGNIHFSPDGKTFAVGIVGEPFVSYGVNVYNLESRKLTHTLIGHRGPVSTMRFSPDGSLLATGSGDTSVMVWDLTKAK